VNITFKKLQDRGPYGIIRHPGTVCKLTFWWLQSVMYIRFWSLEYIFGQIMWSTIYILRALSEERHLSHLPEYRDYKKRVRYRFIPGVI
jgi:protein-S-isoprenylcysteine O-methyltransferase Ste14